MLKRTWSKEQILGLNPILGLMLALVSILLGAELIAKPFFLRHYLPPFAVRSTTSDGIDPPLGADFSLVLRLEPDDTHLVLFDPCETCSARSFQDLLAVGNHTGKFSNATIVVVCDPMDYPAYRDALIASGASRVATISRQEADQINLRYSPRLYVVDSTGALTSMQKHQIPVAQFEKYLESAVK